MVLAGSYFIKDFANIRRKILTPGWKLIKNVDENIDALYILVRANENDFKSQAELSRLGLSHPNIG